MSKADTVKNLQAEIHRLNDEARDLFYDEAWRNEQAQRINTSVQDGFKSANLVELMTQVQYLGRDEVATASVLQGLEAFHVARGGYIEESTLTEDVMYIEKDQIGFHFVDHLDRIEVNFVPRSEQIITLGAQRIDSEISRRVLRTYEAATTIGNGNYAGVSGLGLADLNGAISRVEDAPSPSVGQASPVIVARAPMVAKIVDALTASNAYSLYLPETNDELMKRGQIASYRGIPIVKLPNWVDQHGRPFFKGNEMYVVSKDAAVTAFHGSPRPHNYIAQGEDYWHYIQRIDYGVAVINPEQVFRIVDSTVTP